MLWRTTPLRGSLKAACDTPQHEDSGLRLLMRQLKSCSVWNSPSNAAGVYHGVSCKSWLRALCLLQELHLTGCAVAAKDSFAVVVVEGGPKALKFYKKLMLQRMKWHITVEEEKARAEGEDMDEQPAAGQGEGEAHAALPLLQLHLYALLASACGLSLSTALRSSP